MTAFEDFWKRFAGDSAFRSSFVADPKAEMDKFGLTAEDKAAILANMNLTEFLVKLAVDEEFRARFKNDDEAEMEKAGLSKEAREAIKSGSSGARTLSRMIGPVQIGFKIPTKP